MDVTEEELSAALARTRLGIEQVEEWKFGPTAVPSRPDDLANALLMKIATHREPVVDAHICCDHEPDEVTLADIAGSHVDTELALMAAILHGMEQLDRDARQRIRNWVDERFVPRRLPTV